MMILHNLKVAGRNLLKYKIQSLISIVGLAVGITCFALCNNFMMNYLSSGKDLPHSDRLCFLVDTTSERHSKFDDHRTLQLMQETFSEIETKVMWRYFGDCSSKLCEVTGKGGNKSYFEERFVYGGDTTIVDFFQFRLLYGSWKQVFNTPDAIVLTASTALKMFGKKEAIGETFVQVDDNMTEERRITYCVTAVMEDFPDNSRLSFCSGLGFNDVSYNEKEIHFNTYVLLRDGVSPESLNQKLKAYKSPAPAKSWRNLSKIRVYSVTQYSDYITKGKAIVQPLIFTTVGILVLLAAFFNYILFLSGCWMSRLKECGVRKMSGATRQNLFTLLLTEVTVSVILALGVCFLLVELLVPLFVDIFIIRSVFNLYLQLLQYGVVIIVIMGMLCWLVILKINRMTMLQNLTGGGSIRAKTAVRNVLLGIQLFICMLFLGASVFMRAQLKHCESLTLKGLSDEDKENIYSFNFSNDKLKPLRANFMNELKANPYVERTLRCGCGTLSKGMTLRNFSWEGISEKEKKTKLSFMYVDGNYADFTKTPMVKGRFYTPQEPFCAVVNESMARLLGGDPIGKEISARYWFDFQTYRIIGIIEDLPSWNNNTADYEICPCLYMPYQEEDHSLTYYVKLNPKMKKQVVEQFTQKMRQQVNPTTRLEVYNLSHGVAFCTQSERKMLTMAFVFSLICIVICLLGIYSSMMLATERRRKEVAIRKINGVGVRQIIQLFCRTYFMLLITAFVVVTPLLYWLIKRWLEEYTFHISISVWPFIGLFLVMTLIIFLTILTQLLRVIKLNPAETLKRE